MGGVTISASPAIIRPKPQGQIFITKGDAPWYSKYWNNRGKVTKVDKSVTGQTTVTCDGNVTDMDNMFYECKHLTSIDLFNFDTSKVTSMRWTFDGCTSLPTLDLSNFDTSNVKDMAFMFYWSDKLTSLDISNFDTSKVTDMEGMFFLCRELTTIKGVINMKSCTEYYQMFYSCYKLTNVKIKNPPAGFNGAGLSSSQYTIVS